MSECGNLHFTFCVTADRKNCDTLPLISNIAVDLWCWQVTQVVPLQEMRRECSCCGLPERITHLIGIHAAYELLMGSIRVIFGTIAQSHKA